MCDQVYFFIHESKHTGSVWQRLVNRQLQTDDFTGWLWTIWHSPNVFVFNARSRRLPKLELFYLSYSRCSVMFYLHAVGESSCRECKQILDLRHVLCTLYDVTPLCADCVLTPGGVIAARWRDHRQGAFSREKSI